ncbi:low-affinity Fe(2+) transport protein [Mucor velutinosus]|uniref:Low-affinity Fe(2+) transport protein n=1 Tax=Mucor velutinosus TaxID=708070 RepID=A0AAN7DQT5_9FUNG|nr:low-affinity Fe(2+) transport protein [Mucor velutinosus]
MASGSQGVNVPDMINELITKNKVMVFSKSYCPYCLEAKDLLRELNIAYKAIELDQDPLGYVIQQTLADMTGQWTVPNIFINATSIGGYDDLDALHIKGTLQEMVAAAE